MCELELCARSVQIVIFDTSAIKMIVPQVWVVARAKRGWQSHLWENHFSHVYRTLFWFLKLSKIQKNFKCIVKYYLSSLIGKMRFHGASSDRSAREPAKPVQVSLEYYKGVKVYGWVTNIIFSCTWGKIHFWGLICGRKNAIARTRFRYMKSHFTPSNESKKSNFTAYYIEIFFNNINDERS